MRRCRDGINLCMGMPPTSAVRDVIRSIGDVGGVFGVLIVLLRRNWNLILFQGLEAIGQVIDQGAHSG